MHFTPDHLEAVYELLRISPPFKRWKLPHADELEFFVTNHAAHFGQYNDKDNKGAHNISISARHVKTLQELVLTMAHEMVHQHERRTRPDMTRPWRGAHGPRFKRFAAQVCRFHSWDLETF